MMISVHRLNSSIATLRSACNSSSPHWVVIRKLKGRFCAVLPLFFTESVDVVRIACPISYAWCVLGCVREAETASLAIWKATVFAIFLSPFAISFRASHSQAIQSTGRLIPLELSYAIQRTNTPHKSENPRFHILIFGGMKSLNPIVMPIEP